MLSGLRAERNVVLANRYELSGVLGVGGMGTVYRARDRELDEVVALKVLRRELVAQPGMIERFRREVKLARRVTHRNVARVFDIGEHDGEKFITMELVDGESLAAQLVREARLGIDEVVAITSAIVAGLGAAHAAGVVHRDLKPDNVLVALDGRVALTDFGIARALAYAGQAPGRTLGFVVGTPDYMSPEQIENAAVIDGRADLYALGVMLFEMLTGEAPFKGDSPLAIVTARLLSPPPDPRRIVPDIPDALARLVLRLLARAPAERPADAAEVASILGGLTLPAPAPRKRISARPGSPARGPRRIAVVPLATRSPDLAWLGYGLAELVADALDGRAGVDVRARGAQLVDVSHRPLDALGEDLGVPLVIGGTIDVGDDGAPRGELRLVNARDNFVLWSRALAASAKSQPLAVASRAADEIARTLLIGERGHATTAADERAVAACLRARWESARGGADGADRAISLYERAITRAPDDAWVKASYAHALARRVRETELPGDADEAVAMAEAAVAREPSLAAAHLAIAEIKLDRGQALEAARSLVVARSHAPSNADGERLLARILADIGQNELALEALRSAASREARSWRPAWDETRVLFALGRVAEAEATLDAGAEAEPHAPHAWLGRVRFAIWRGDHEEAMRSIRRQLEGAILGERELVVVVLEAALGRASLGSALAHVEAQARSAGDSQARRGFIVQLGVELALAAREAPRAEALLSRHAADIGLDVAWLSQCPALAPLRTSPTFARVRDDVQARARAVHTLLTSSPETLPGARA